MIAGLVAAAGKGERLRKSGHNVAKALMPHPLGGTFVEHLTHTLLNEVERVFVTLPDEGADLIRERFNENARVDCLNNLYMSRGLIGSIQSVHEHAPSLKGLIFTPTDLPLLWSNDVAALKQSLDEHASACLVYRGQRGHPAALQRSLFAKAALYETPKTWFREAHEIETQNDLCLQNINDGEALNKVSARLLS